MNKNTTNTKKNKSTNTSPDLNYFKKYSDKEIRNLLRDFDTILIMYILKIATNEEHAFSAPEITDQLNHLFETLDTDEVSKDEDHELFSSRTIRRDLVPFLQVEECQTILDSLLTRVTDYVYGGKISSRAADGIQKQKNKKSTGTQKRYYFKPLLDKSDMTLIYGSISSNRYLSDEEKSYLMEHLRLLQPDFALDTLEINDRIAANRNRFYENIFADLPDKPKQADKPKLPVNSKTLLINIKKLYEAILNGYQIEMIYGKYDKDTLGRLTFYPRHEGNAYILNPYALTWSLGEYYLIATVDASDKPIHFRVDRVIDVKVHKTEIDGDAMIALRSPIPATLKPFFSNKSGKLIFNSIKYTNKYPGMKVYNDPRLIDCVFECTSDSLQVLVDNFGTNVRISESPIVHSKDDLDYKGRPQSFLKVTVKDVQYDNAKRLCIELSQYFTLLEPIELLEDVTHLLDSITNRYKSVLDEASN